jgi:CRP-like cAMP-binding protein
MSQPESRILTGNSLLDGLPEEDLLKVWPHLKRVSLKTGQELSLQGERVDEVYFPTSALISCRATGLHGELIEIYAVGDDGVADAASILTSVAAVTAEVQIAGEAYRIKIDELCALIRESAQLSSNLLKYAYSLAVRMVQATKCAMFHSLKQRLVLWLLMAHRAHGDDIPCTHQVIADSLGARRAGVTVILNELQSEGILSCRRGHIQIRSNAKLESGACDCFQLIKEGVRPPLECDLTGTKRGSARKNS